MPQAPKDLNKIESLQQIVADLRGPQGCPWDLQQNHQTLAPYAIEEAAELAEALEKKVDSEICDELGDVLFQVILHSQLASERKAFELSDVVQSISEKIVRRHPHVFSDVQVSGADEVIQNWDEIKKLEKKNKPQRPIEVPEGLPALQRAHKIGAKTKKLNFDWEHARQVMHQLRLEIEELEQALMTNNLSEIKHEIGDVLFSTAQLSRHLNIESESALREANRRFLHRFETMLDLGQMNTEQFKNLSNEEKEKLWSQAKLKTKKS